MCVRSCARSACTPQFLAGVYGAGVCAWARVSAVARHSWLGCWGVCAFVCALLLYSATLGWGVRCGSVCLGLGFGCAPPLLAGVSVCLCACVRAPLAPRHCWLGCAVWVCVLGLGSGCAPSPLAGMLGCVCVCVRAPLVPRHSWLGCVVWVSVLRLGSRLRPATPGWGVGVCVCLCARSGCTPPLLAWLCGVWVWCCLATVSVPWFIACCARCPGLRHPAAVVASHMSLCLSCGRRRASLACLVAPRGAPRLVRPVALGAPVAFPTPWCLSPAQGLAPPAVFGGCAGHAEAGREPGSLCLPLAPAEAGALGWLRVIHVRGPALGLSLADPSGVCLGLRALRWLACLDLVGDASRFAYRPSSDGGLGRYTGGVSCGRRHRPFQVGGGHARVPCVCACACPSWPGRAGQPPGRVLVRLTFSCRRSWCALCWFGPPRAGVALFVVVIGCSCFFFLVAPPLSPVVSVLRLGSPWALVSCGPPACPPLVCLFFPLPCLWCSVVSGPGCLGPWPSLVPSPGSPLCFFHFSPSPPPLFFFFLAVLLFFVGLLFFLFFFLFPLLPFFFPPWCADCAVLGPVRVSWVVGCAGVCCCGHCGPARAGVRLCCVVGCFCRCLVPCCGPWLCSVLGCGAVLLWCAASRVVWCCPRRVLLVVPCCFVRAGWSCVLLPVVAGCSLLGLVARRCFSLMCVFAGAPAWPLRLLPCCVLWLVVVPCSPVLCPVYHGPVLPCGAVLWRPAVRFSLLVVLVCVLFLCVRCCVALRVVLFGAGLVRAVVAASCCGLSLCFVVSPLVFCGVVVLLWCVVVSCCAVLCAVVLRRLVVPWCWAVLCVFSLLRVFLFS